MLRLLSLLCLVLALSDPLLRQWEAAADLALTLAELSLGDALNEIEPMDDGIADDPGEAILKAGGDGSATQASVPSLMTPDELQTRFILAPIPSGFEPRPQWDRPPRLLVGSSRRQALLQRYLI